LKSSVPSTLRVMNKSLVLNVIRQHGPLSRAQIAKRTEMTRATISEIVNELLQEDAVRETGSDNSPIGRKGILVSYNADLGYGVGIDLGGTKIALSLFDVNAEILVQETVPTYRVDTSGAFIALLAESIRELIRKHGYRPEGLMVVGMATPGIVDYKNGIVVEGSPNLPDWENLNLSRELEQALGVPVVIENDVRAALIGEIWKGRCQQTNSAAMISIGTGIGSALLIDGKVVRGAGNAAGEIGYMLFTQEHLSRNWSNKGCLESVCSGSGLMLSVQEQYADRASAPTWSSAAEVFADAKAGNAEAAKLIDEMVGYLAIAILNIIAVINPETIVLGGGVSRSADYFLERLRREVGKHTFSRTEVQIVVSELKEAAALSGIAILALSIVRPTVRFLPDIKLT